MNNLMLRQAWIGGRPVSSERERQTDRQTETDREIKRHIKRYM